MHQTMNPIDTPDRRFKDGNPATGEYGTVVTAEHLNNVQDSVISMQNEIITVLNEAGIVVNPNDNTQLWQALQVMSGQVESIEALRTFEPLQDKQVAFVKGYYAGTTVGGGFFIADVTNTTSADNGGTVIVTDGGKRWLRIYTEVFPEDFGARGDGVTDDLLALKAASAFNTLELRTGAVYYIGEQYSTEFDPDFSVKGLGKIKWGNHELSGYEVEQNLKTESVYLTPNSWHKATRQHAEISPIYPPYAPIGRGEDIYNKYNTVLSWRSVLSNPTIKVSAVTAYGANIGVSPKDWTLTDAYGQDAMMFAQLSDRNTAIGSETMVWLGASSRAYLEETNHDWYRNISPNEWTAENSKLENLYSGIGREIYDFSDYPTSKADTSHNVAIGRDSLLHLVKGSRNVGIGYSAGGESLNANDNVYVGFNAGRYAVFGSNNVALGARALQSGVKLSQFSAIGYGAARSAVEGWNSFVGGYLAAEKAIKITNSVILGAYAAQNETNLVNKLAIGATITGDLAAQKIGVNIPVSDTPLADLHIRRKGNAGSGRTTSINGLLIEDSGAANITADGGTYGNFNFHCNGVLKGGFQYGFNTGNIAVIVGGSVSWRFYEDASFRPNVDNVSSLGSPSKRLQSVHVTTPAQDSDMHKVLLDTTDDPKAYDWSIGWSQTYQQHLAEADNE